MRNWSIKAKITLWYTGIVAIILSTVFAAVLLFVNKIGLSVTEEEVQGAVTGFMGNITFEDNTYYLDGDTEFYDDGVMFCVYDENGKLHYGSMPVDFPRQEHLQSHHARVVENNSKKWIVYDGVYSYGENKSLWVRGITSIHNMESIMSSAIKAVAIIIPGLILLIGCIGYFTIKRALRPVDDICSAADEISSGEDLSKRLPVPKVKDEMRKLTERFNEMFERLEESFENEKQFTADASHELRTPVSVLISQCEYLLEQEQLTQDQRQEIEVILRQGQKMSQLIAQLLMIARESQGSYSENFESVDFGILVEIVAEELGTEAEKKSIVMELDIQNDVLLNGDQTLLMRMMMNLINNAIFYGREQGHVRVKVYKEGNVVRGEVSDDGIGIAREHLDKIWNRFYRVDKSRSSKTNGTGLGLSMVKWIVKVHGGEINVHSIENVGTVFSFWFPKE